MKDKKLRNFLKKVHIPFGENVCWNWTAAKNTGGYGIVSDQNTSYTVHRLSFEHFVGEIPPKYCLEHTCGNRSCVNPAHLKAVTYGAIRAKKPKRPKPTYCKFGHKYIPTKQNRCSVCKKLDNKWWEFMAKLSDLKPAFYTLSEEEQFRILETVRQNRINKLIERRTTKVKNSRPISRKQQAAQEMLSAAIEYLRQQQPKTK